MHVIEARNVDEALYKGANYLAHHGRKETSRAGDVWVAPGPVTTVFTNPMDRVLFNPVRDANPFFHLFEALFYLAGRNDIKWLDQFISDFSARFAQPDGTLHGSYGYRWRHHFDMEGGGSPFLPDQLDTVVHLLMTNFQDRQAVLTMWDPVADLGYAGLKDRPCNTHIYLRVRVIEGPPLAVPTRRSVLDITVCCRSNDIIWGAYGANVVQFSILQEYLAARIGVGVGQYYQVSNNYHAYDATLKDEYWQKEQPADRYLVANPTPIVTEPEAFDHDLEVFLQYPGDEQRKYNNKFFHEVAVPLYKVHAAWKANKPGEGLMWARDMDPQGDWRMAVEQWLQRRLEKRANVGA